MQFASERVISSLQVLNETEDLFEDEVEDGLANCAREQAIIWAQACKEKENQGLFDSSFLKTLQEMARVQTGKNNLSKNTTHHDVVAFQNGVFASERRAQPRFTKQKQIFDQLCNARIKSELSEQNTRTNLSRKNDKAPLYSEEMIPSSPLEVNPQVGQQEQEQPSLIIDIGSLWVWSGFEGDDSPRSVFPCIVGRPRHTGVMVGMGQKDSYVGDEAQSKRGILTQKRPVGRVSGKTTYDWDDFEKVLSHTIYNELRCAPEECHVVLIQKTCADRDLSHQKRNFSKITQIAFETFNVPSLSLVDSSLASWLASGRKGPGGIIVDIGGSETIVAAVWNDHVLGSSVFISSSISGKAMTDYLLKIVTERGYSFTTKAERDILEDIKEKICYVSKDFETEMSICASSSELEKNYELPDGQVITLGNERSRAGEMIFRPSFVDSEEFGIHELVYNCLQTVSSEMRSILVQNIILVGGCSALPGISERLEKELKNLLSPSDQTLQSLVQVTKMNSPRTSSWEGASAHCSFLARLSKETYDEEGPEASQLFLNKYYILGVENLSAVKPIFTVKSSGPQTKKEISTISSRPQETKSQIQKKLAHTNALYVTFSKLQEKSPQMTGDPIICQHCGAALDINANLKLQNEVDPDLFTWNCIFCDHEESIYLDPSEIPQSNCIEYTIHSSVSNVKSPPKVIFLIDISGSMCVTTELGGSVSLHQRANRKTVDAELLRLTEGTSQWRGNSNVTFISRLQCVQAAVHGVLENLKKESPETYQAALITFNHEVCIYGDGTTKSGEFQILAGDELNNFDSLYEKGKKDNSCLQTINQSCEKLIDQVYALEEGGATALGPALVYGLAMTELSPGSRIILCTDGKSNVGVGNLEQNSSVEVGEFYRKLGLIAKKNRCSVNIISIRSQEESALETLGVVADLSSGVVSIVDPIKLKTSPTLNDILKNPIIGTDVDCSIYLPSSFCFSESTPEITPLPNILHQDFGVVTSDTNITTTFEYVLPHPLDKQFICFQTKIKYVTEDGTQRIRILSEKMRSTSERKEAEDHCNTSIIGLTSIQSCAKIAEKGDYTLARQTLVTFQRLFQRAMRTSEQQGDYINFIIQGERLDGFMREIQRQQSTFDRMSEQQKEIFLREKANQNQQKDDSAAKNILQMKRLPLQAFKSSKQPGIK